MEEANKEVGSDTTNVTGDVQVGYGRGSPRLTRKYGAEGGGEGSQDHPGTKMVPATKQNGCIIEFAIDISWKLRASMSI